MTNNEFKITAYNKQTTVYTLESASGGGTSSGSVASVSMPIGGMQRRKGDNLIAQEAGNKVPATTPRNFVAKNAKTSGAGAHKDKKKAEKQGTTKHKKPYMESFNGEYDDEAGMAHTDLHTIARAAQGLLDTIDDKENLPEWAQEKIAKVEGMIVAVWDYLRSQEEQGIDPRVDQGVAEAKGKLTYTPEPTEYGVFPDSKNEFVKTFLSRDLALAHIKKFGGKLIVLDQHGRRMKQGVAEEWGQKYKSSINCSHPKGFSQKAHCAGKKKHNESMMTMEAVCPDCGMCQTHGDNMMEVKQRLDAKCWSGKHKEGTKIKGGIRVNNCVPNEDVAEVFTNNKETGTTHKGGVVTKTAHGTKHTKTDYDDGHGEKGRKSSGKENRYKQTPILDKDDEYFESLNFMLERQLEPTMDLDAWNDNFQNADPQKYHQFKNKSPEKKK